MGHESFNRFIDDLINHSPENREQLVNKFLEDKKVPIIENKNEAHFIYFGNATELKICGDLQSGWSKSEKLECINCGESNFFYRSYKLPSDSRLDYKLEADGQHINDPLNPDKIPSGYGYNSELIMPDFKKSRSLLVIDGVNSGTIVKLNLVFNNKEINAKELKIYLPFGYEELSELPCIYVFDGDDMLNFAYYKNVLDNCIDQKKIEPIVAVFITTEDRSNEYLNLKKKSLMDVLINEIIPEIERKYNVAKNPKMRALHGISAGGYFSLCSIFKHPDVFQKVAAQSSAIKTKLFNIFSDTMRNGGIPYTSNIYMDVGRFDLEVYKYDIPWVFLDVNRKFRDELQKHEIPYRYNEFNDGHSWGNWQERIEEILIYFFGTGSRNTNTYNPK